MVKHRHTKQPSRAATPAQAWSGAPAVATPEAELRHGLAAWEQGDYGQVIQFWKHAQREGARAGVARALAEAHFRRALAATTEGRRVQELLEAVQLAPDRAVYHFHLGLAYHRQGQLRRALAAYETAHRLAPNDARLRRHLALARLSDPTAALDVEPLLAGAPVQDEATVRLRALIALRQNEPTTAVATLAALTRPSPLASVALGLAQLGAGRPAAARETLARLRRSRRPLGAQARQAAAIVDVIARLQAGDPAGALDALRSIELPTEPMLRQALAVAARRLAQELVLDERAAEAAVACQQALAAAPDHAPTRCLLVHLHEVLGTRAARRGDFAAATRHWEAALADQPGDGRILRNLALAEERLERWERASAHWDELTHLWKKELRAADRRDPATGELRQRLAVAYRHLAATYAAADDIHTAARSLESALKFDPSQVDLRLRVAELYLENEEYGKAIDHLRHTLAARPNDTRVLVDLGSAYDLKGDDRQAQSYLEQALALEPENGAVKATLAGVHHARLHRLLRAGQAERAAAEGERAVELDPATAEHYECLGESYLKLGRLDAARAAFARALALAPKSPETRVAIGRAYLAHGFEPEAEKLFGQALRLRRGALTQLAIGLTYLQLGRVERARQHFQQVLKTRQPFLHATVGKLLIEAEQEEEAIPFLERAVSQDPLDSRARLDLAWAYTFGRGDDVRASDELAKAERAAEALGDHEDLAEIDTAKRMLEVLRMDAAPGRRGPPSRGERWR